MRNKFLKITGVMVLVIALVGFWGYDKYIAPDPEIQQQLNDQFGEDFFNSFDDENILNNLEDNIAEGSNSEDDDSIDNNSEDNVTDDDSSQEVNSVKPEPENNDIAENQPSTKQQITQNDILDKYKPQFYYLQNLALNRLDTLHSAAVQEYVQNKKDGTLNRSELAQKYIQAGNRLEANVDKSFNSTLNAMKAELIANNLDTNIVDVSKNDYEKAKSNKRSELLDKVLK